MDYTCQSTAATPIRYCSVSSYLITLFVLIWDILNICRTSIRQMILFVSELAILDFNLDRRHGMTTDATRVPSLSKRVEVVTFCMVKRLYDLEICNNIFPSVNPLRINFVIINKILRY